jgi:UPF0716 protein FxsA
MFAFIGVVVVATPIVELIVIAAVADRIGLIPTLLLLLGLTLAGVWLFVHQGIRTWRRLRDTIRRREMPSEELADAALLMFGGVLLLTPGFVTDVVALFFVLPGSRRALGKVARRFLGALALSRFGWMGRGGTAAKRVYDARVTKVRSGGRDEVRPGLPAEPSGPPPSSGRPDDGDGSPDTG